MAAEERDIATIKAYELGSSIVVKYFDAGDGLELSCPFCHWFGDVRELGCKSGSRTEEVVCPDCQTKLASVTSKVGV